MFSLVDGFLFLHIQPQQVRFRVPFLCVRSQPRVQIKLLTATFYTQLTQVAPVTCGNDVVAAPAIHKKHNFCGIQKHPKPFQLLLSHTVALLYHRRHRCQSESPKREQNASLSPTWPLQRGGGGNLKRGRCLPDNTWSNCCMSGTRTARFLTKRA